MNLAQAKTTLEKIITLYKTMSADDKNISPIERDLMLSYIRQLYEVFLEPATPSVSTPPKVTPMPKVTPPLSPEPPLPSVVEMPPPPIVVVQAPPPPQTPPPPPVVFQAPPPPKAEPIHVAPPPPFSRPTPPVSYAPKVSPEIAALFEETSGKELSDKLSNTPIPDLTKAFGLNDRLLTQNELFGGNKPVFDEAVKDLNNMSSFETARNFLFELAARYNWAANEDRKKQAKAFIKLVRRRLT